MPKKSKSKSHSSKKSNSKPHHTHKKPKHTSKHFINTGQLPSRGSKPRHLSHRDHDNIADTSPQWQKRTIHAQQSVDILDHDASQESSSSRKTRRLQYLNQLIRMHWDVTEHLSREQKDWFDEDDVVRGMDLGDLMNADWMKDVEDEGMPEDCYGLDLGEMHDVEQDERMEHVDMDLDHGMQERHQEEATSDMSDAVDSQTHETSMDGTTLAKPHIHEERHGKSDASQHRPEEMSASQSQSDRASHHKMDNTPQTTSEQPPPDDDILDSLLKSTKQSQSRKNQQAASSSHEMDELDDLLGQTNGSWKPQETHKEAEDSVDDIDDFLDNL